MENVYSGGGILKVALQIEKNGWDFYEALAEQAKNPDARETFRFLAAEERRHIDVFIGLLNAIKDEVPDFSKKSLKYIETLAKDHIFTREEQGKAMAQTMEDDRDALNLGIKFERDSIVFFEAMRELMPPGDMGTLNILVAQERNHLRKLYSMRARLG